MSGIEWCGTVLVGIMLLEVLGNGFLSYAGNDIPLLVSLTHTLLAIFLWTPRRNLLNFGSLSLHRKPAVKSCTNKKFLHVMRGKEKKSSLKFILLKTSRLPCHCRLKFGNQGFTPTVAEVTYYGKSQKGAFSTPYPCDSGLYSPNSLYGCISTVFI